VAIQELAQNVMPEARRAIGIFWERGKIADDAQARFRDDNRGLCPQEAMIGARMRHARTLIAPLQELPAATNLR
jgi:hypothetical protein